MHPRHKKAVGLRLAAAALQHIYKRPKSTATRYRGPVFTHAEVEEAGKRRVLVRFDETTVEPALVVREAACPAEVPRNMCNGWELRAPDGAWHAARVVEVEGATVVVEGDVGMGDATPVRLPPHHG